MDVLRGIGIVLALGAAGCGVLANEGGGDRNLPDARLGPFRTFGEGEVSLPPMAVLDFEAALGGPDVTRQADGTLGLFVHAAPDDAPVAVIRRLTGESPTAFTSPEVLLDGEPAGLYDPAFLEHDGESLLFFGVGGGAEIGVARWDGGAFARDGVPVLTARDAAASPVGAPSVAVLPDGRWLLYHARGSAIALATSEDGASFEERSDEVLGPGAAGAWDAGGVGDPEVALVRTALGEPRVRLYYTGWSADDPPVRGIGVAVSFDGVAGFQRFVGNPIVVLDGDESAPAVALGGADDPVFLYFARASGTGRPGIAGAVLPGDVVLAAD